MSTLRTRTSVVPVSAGSVVARQRGNDYANHPMHNLPQRSVYAKGFAALGQTHPTVKVSTSK